VEEADVTFKKKTTDFLPRRTTANHQRIQHTNSHMWIDSNVTVLSYREEKITKITSKGTRLRL